MKCDVTSILAKYNNDSMPCNAASAYVIRLAFHTIMDEGFPPEFLKDEKSGYLFRLVLLCPSIFDVVVEIVICDEYHRVIRNVSQTSSRRLYM